MPNKNYLKGYRNEQRSKNILMTHGFTVIRAGGSHGLWDLVALHPVYGIRPVQVKTNRMPTPKEMTAMRAFPCTANTTKLIHLYRDGSSLPKRINV